jgi:hypothetical protein
MENTKHWPLIVLALLMTMEVIAAAQTQRPGEAFSVQGYPGQTTVVQLQGRGLVDLQDLARITNGSLSFERDRVILTLPGCEVPQPAGDNAGKSGFSRGFRRAAIEAMASIREWGGTLRVIVQNGLPVGNSMAGQTITAFQGRAVDSLALASAAASTDSDYRGLELLRNEFNNLQAWNDSFVQARSAMSATNLTISENALQNDPEVQKMVHCGQFLAQMFAGGSFQDDAACH